MHTLTVHSQIRNTYIFKEEPDYIYLIEQVPLPANLQGFNATSIYQDTKGFMWFGGEQGLLRYDGSKIREFRYDPDDPQSVGFKRVNTIAEDSSGTIWLGTWRGLIGFNPLSNTFTQFLNQGDIKFTWNWNSINDMESDNHQIWIATNSGLCRFDILTGKFDRHKRLHDLIAWGGEDWTHSVSKCNDHVLFLRHGTNLIKYDITADTLSAIPEYPPGFSKSYFAGSGTFLVPSWSGLYEYNLDTGSYQRIELNKPDRHVISSSVYSIVDSPDGNYWISTHNGIALFSESWQPIRFWSYDFAVNGQDATENQFRAMYTDRSGTLWFSTPGQINRIIRKPRVFECNDLQNTTYINTIHVNDSSLWVLNAFNLLCLNHDKTINRRYHNQSVDPLQRPILKNFVFDRKGRLWIGSKNSGVFLSDNIHSEQPVFNNPFRGVTEHGRILGRRVKSIYKDSTGKVWITAGVSWPQYIAEETGELVFLEFSPADDDIPKEVRIQTEIGHGTYLASTESGVIIFSLPETGNKSDSVIVEDYEIYPIHQGKELANFRTVYLSKSLSKPDVSYIWSSISQQGIQLWEYDFSQKKGSRFNRILEINANNGLITNDFTSIIEDDNGILYFGSENGITRLNPFNGSFTTYTRNQGLDFDEITPNSVDKGPDGKIYFGTDFGLLSFHPDSIVLNNDPPPVFITDIKANGISLQDDSLSSVSFHQKEKFTLGYRQNNLTFEFAALNYIHSERNHFKIQLEGFDDDWIPVGNLASVEYYNLKPGMYRFRVIGSNNDDVWNMTGDTFSFRVKKPPWFTWIAFLIYVLILSGVAFFYFRYVRYRSRKNLEIEKERIERQTLTEVDEMKSRFFANISHEFRTPLTLIMSHVRELESQQGQDVRMKRSALSVLGRNARRLLLLINQLLDIARLEKNAMQLELKLGNLSEWVRVLVSSFQSLADSQDIRFTVRIDDPGREVCFDSDKTEKIITNLLSNAFKFTEKGGSIVFCLKYFTSEENGYEYVEIEVKDTGKGIHEDQLTRIFDRFYQVSASDAREVEGSGIGLSLIKELVELLNGTIQVQSEPGKGTALQVVLPVSQDCFPEEEISMIDPDEIAFPEDIKVHCTEENGQHKESTLEHDKILVVVEDNDDLRNYLIRQLSTEYKVVPAKNGKEGMELVRGHLPDLVISDLMMPVMSGTEMTAKLKQDPATNHIPVIMLTAKADKESKLKGLDTGADDYVIKPFDAEELMARVRNLIRQREVLRKKFTQNYLQDNETQEATRQFIMLREILDVIKHHLGDPEFTLESFAAELGMSRTQLYRKIRSITSNTPNELVRIVRMKHAARLLRSDYLNVSQVMYEVGMKNPSHFAKTFRKYFGENPREYRSHTS